MSTQLITSIRCYCWCILIAAYFSFKRFSINCHLLCDYIHGVWLRINKTSEPLALNDQDRLCILVMPSTWQRFNWVWKFSRENLLFGDFLFSHRANKHTHTSTIAAMHKNNSRKKDYQTKENLMGPFAPTKFSPLRDQKMWKRMKKAYHCHKTSFLIRKCEYQTLQQQGGRCCKGEKIGLNEDLSRKK